MAKIGDEIRIRVVGINREGTPDGIEVVYFRNGAPIFPGICDGSWSELRHALAEALRLWWKNRPKRR